MWTTPRGRDPTYRGVFPNKKLDMEYCLHVYVLVYSNVGHVTYNTSLFYVPAMSMLHIIIINKRKTGDETFLVFRRTADVRSVGYSELFSLSREDVLAAMKDYPEAQEILQSLGRKRLMEARHVSRKDHGTD